MDTSTSDLHTSSERIVLSTFMWSPLMLLWIEIYVGQGFVGQLAFSVTLALAL
ncbi:hypothetical protein DPMN_170027 [Dreissena polymorpha]|uniref:Uncharacterized protein n=1 Tax=Dreissena polymorpha TaxID=45954 RepID=A0A9D4DWB9_DREPO|nr:hypothetical protein DPMN_170027 [Dreissena polymorpha]